MNSRFSIVVILLILLSISSLANSPADKDLRVISSNNKYLLIEYTPKYADTAKVYINNQQFIKVSLLNGEILSPEDNGTPAYPVRTISIGVPGEYGNTVQVIETDYREIDGKLSPKPRVIINNGLTQYSYELTDKYYSGAPTTTTHELVGFGSYGLCRDIPIQSIVISPVEFSPTSNKIRLYTRIVFQVNFSSKALSQSLSQQKPDRFISDGIINFEVAKSWSVVKKALSLRKGKFNSVLSQGKWLRFEAPEEGIYKITPEILSSLGINPQTVDPKTIKIYNNGGKALPEVVGGRRPEDLQENSVYLSKQTDDGKFNPGDFILFYGRGIHFWDYDSTQKKVTRFYHPYSKSNYFFLTYGGNPSKKMQDKPSLTQPSAYITQSTNAYASWEQDEYKLLNSGRQYMGDLFAANQNSRTYMTNLSGIIPGSKITYRFDFVSRAEAYAGLRVEENAATGQNVVFDGTIEGLGYQQLDNAEGYRGIEKLATSTLQPTLQGENSILKFTYTPHSDPSTGYMNYFELYYTKQLKAYSDQLLFFSPDTASSTVVEYHISGFSNTDFMVFDLSDYADVRLITGANKSGGDCQFQASEVKGRVSKYYAVGSNSFKTPLNFAEITNSNLHGMPDEGRFIIITHRNFLDQAKRLKAHKESLAAQKVSTVVVDCQDIFNEFSAGMQDVSAIRDFIKYAYDNWTVRPEYVLLFGDGDYDYKDVEAKHQNFIIPYESYDQVFDSRNTYATDDYYACVSGRDFIVDVALGRINVTNQQEAQNAVDKIIKYESNKKLGLWRNLITLVADDNLNNGEYDNIQHTSQSETLSSYYIDPSLDQRKIYEIQYPTVETSAGQRKPKAAQALLDVINSGTLVFNWIGHGNETVLGNENVFERETTIPQLKNDSCLFFLTAATCEFGKYDNTESQCATELLILKPDGGAIGALASARPSYPFANNLLNNTFYSNLFKRDQFGKINPVGLSYMLTKISTFPQNGENDLKYHLFGDPTLRLLVPQMPVSIDSINGKQTDTLRALSKVRVSGSVRNSDKSNAEDFNGECLLTVFDSERHIYNKELSVWITLQGGTIYRGRVSVSSGRFTTEFIVPKDISYQNEHGKVEAYVQGSSNTDGLGYSKSITVGGTDTTVQNDKKGPEISLAFDDLNGENSVLVRPTFNLFVKLKDETGLNLTGSGIGHRLEAVLNGNENDPIDLTGEFTGDLNSGGRSGVVRHQFQNLKAGQYKVSVKAWDVFNNSSESEKTFTVAQSEGLVLEDVYNYPNPFKDQTTFTFQYNLDEPLSVKIKVYTVSGRMIRSIETQSNQRFVKVDWDGRDQDGNMIANGTYLYKVSVKTLSESYSQEVLGKLALIR